MTTYRVFWSVWPLGTVPYVSESPDQNKVVIVVERGKSLPVLENLIVLHSDHANNSQAMSFEKDRGTFTCVHCGKKVAFSKNLLKSLLAEISAEGFEDVEDDKTKARIALLVTKNPWMPLIDVIYAIKQD